MHRSKRIAFNGADLDILELTVVQMQEIIESLENGSYRPHLLDMLMDHMNFPARSLFMALGVDEKKERLDFTTMPPGIDFNVPPSKLEELYREVKEVNPFYASTMERMRKVGDKLQESGEQPAG